MDPKPVGIRGGRPDDLDALYRICLQTADNGRDATALFRDPKLPGHVYVGPYVAFEPSLAFIAEDDEAACGYVVAVLDSRAFVRRLEQDWWPTLRARYPEPSADLTERMSLPGRYAIHDIHHPFGTFSSGVPISGRSASTGTSALQSCPRPTSKFSGRDSRVQASRLAKLHACH